MKLTVNGVEREIESPPLTPLLHVLREELGITSPKAGCQQGGCGACTVLVDGAPRRACLLPVAALDGAEITTVEGLGTPEALSPIQAAFHEHYAAQCGFCTSGMVLAAHALPRGAAARPNARRSRRRSPATSAAAPATSRSSTPSRPPQAARSTATQRWLPQPGEEAPVEVPGAPA